MRKTKAKPAKKAPPAPAAPAVGAPAPDLPPAPQPGGLAAAPPAFHPLTLPLRALTPSPTNPRKAFDEAGLAQLAQSIRQVGVAQPLVVRPLGERPRREQGGWVGVDRWEVVAGERRYRAAGLAGLTHVPCSAAVMTDDQVLYVQLVENEQRADVLPSERAAAFAALAAAGKRAEDVSAATGLPLATVRDLIRLAKLPAWMLAAVDAGDVLPSVAALVARIPDAENRRRASACVLLGDDYPDRLDAQDFELCESGKARSSERNDYIEPVLTYRDTKDLLREFQRELKGAPFRKALDLVPGAPTCDDCPKRAGNAAKADDTFADVRADTCLDTACFAAKTAAWGKLVAAKAEKKGRTVVMGDEAAKLFYPHGGLRHGCGYIDPGQTCWEDKQPGNDRTYGELLKGHVEPVVVVGPDGRAHDLYAADVARQALKEHHGIGTKPAKGGDAYKRQEAEQRRKQEIGRAAAAKALGHVAGRMEAADQSHAADARLREVALLRQVARAVVDHAGADACRMVAKRRGLKYDPVNTRQVVEDLALEMTEVHELLGLMAESCAARMANYWGHPYGGGNVGKEEAAFWAAFGVDKAALVKAAGEELKAAKKKPAAKKGGRAGKPEAAEADTDADAGGAMLTTITDLPAEVFDLLDGDGCLTAGEAWSAAQAAADTDLLKRPGRDVLRAYLKDLGAKPVAADRAADSLAKALWPAGKAGAA